MLKIVVLGTTALFLTGSSIANAQSSQTSQASATPERLNGTDRNTLTDMRVDLVKAALQLRPEQEKSGPLWRAQSVPVRRIGKPVLRKSRKPWVDGPTTKAVWKSCAIVTPSPFCIGARKRWLNDPSI